MFKPFYLKSFYFRALHTTQTLPLNAKLRIQYDVFIEIIFLFALGDCDVIINFTLVDR